MDKIDASLKVVLLVEPETEETCIIQNTLDKNTISTYGNQFINKTMKFKDINKIIRFVYCDTTGHEKYRH